MKGAIAAIVVLACAGLSFAKDTPRLRETPWRPTVSSDGLGSALMEGPERVAGYFRLNRTYAGMSRLLETGNRSLRSRTFRPCYARSFCWRPRSCPAVRLIWMHVCAGVVEASPLPPGVIRACALAAYLRPVLILMCCLHAAEMFYFYFQVRVMPPMPRPDPWAACSSLQVPLYMP